MLVNFGIDPDAIDNTTTAYHISELRTKWQNLGVLSHPSYDDGGFRNIRRKFPELNQSIQRIWARVWREIENDPSSRYPRCRGNFSLALVSETHAQKRQIPNGNSEYLYPRDKRLGRVEWIRLTEVNASKEFERAETISRSPIRRGKSVERLWRERFQSLAKFSREIVIIDRNAATQGLASLLGFIDGAATNCAVTIYSSLYSSTDRHPPEKSDLNEYRTSALDFENIDTLTIYLPQNYHFGREGRDRFVRFDERAFSLGHGITEILQGSAVETGTTFGPTELQYMQDLESRLKGNTLPENIIVMQQSDLVQ